MTEIIIIFATVVVAIVAWVVIRLRERGRKP